MRKMDIRAQIIRNNTNLLQELNKVSMLNQKYYGTRNFHIRPK